MIFIFDRFGFWIIFFSLLCIGANGTIKNSEKKRQGKFISELFKSDAFSCVPQLMCQMITANKPTSRTRTLNDYKYLVNEFFLRPESEEEAKESPSNKYKSQNSRNSDESNSSPEDSGGGQTKEDKHKENKLDELVELMELEDDDELEDIAVNDMVDGDPDDFVFALADIKKKQRLKQLAANKVYRTRLKRNLEILSSTLRDRENIFRRSRAIKEDAFLQKKLKELRMNKNPMDRVRIAAEVASTTRNGRKCRSLFDSCRIPENEIESGAEMMKGKFRNGNHEVHDERVKLRQEEIPSGSTDVKLVLNIGPAGYHSPIYSPYQGYIPMMHTTTDQPTTTEKFIHRNKPVTRMISMLKPKINERMESQQKKADKKMKYKKHLKEASKLLSKIPAAIKSLTQSKTFQAKPQSKMKQRPKKQTSKESSEKSVLAISRSSEWTHQPKILHPPVINRRILVSSPELGTTKTTPSNSWMELIYQILFKSREVLPLPSDPQDWISSAQRHAGRIARTKKQTFSLKSFKNFFSFKNKYF